MDYLLDSNIVKSELFYFNDTKDSKCVSFFFDNKEYNLYIKYSKTFIRDKKEIGNVNSYLQTMS